MRDAQGVSVRAYEAAEEETANGREGKERASVPQNGEEEEKRRGVSQESPQVFVHSLPMLKKTNAFFSRKIRPFETKVLLLHLIKHNFPFIPPHCGVHIAQSRGTAPTLRRKRSLTY